MYYFLGYLILSYILNYLALKILANYTNELDYLDDSDLGLILLFSPISIFYTLIGYIVLGVKLFIPILEYIGRLI